MPNWAGMSAAPRVDGISAVVCNYQGESVLRDCLAALVTQERVEEVIVVDNGSSDGSLQLVRERFPRVEVIQLGRNEGPCVARNAGMRAARHRFVLAVDNDARLEPGVAARLAAALEAHPDAAVAQPRSLHAGDPARVHYDGADVHFAGLLALRNFYRPLAQAEGRGVVEVGAFVALCVLVDRDVLLSLGGYDPRYFILFEDLDLSLRLRQRGHRILSVEDALVRHGSGTPGTSFRAGGYPARRAYLHARNRWHLLAKCWSPSTLLVTLPGLVLYECVEIAFALLGGNLLAFVRGRVDLLQGLRATLAARRTVQRLRRVPDRELMVGGPLTLSPLVLATPVSRALARALDASLRTWWAFVRPMCG